LVLLALLCARCASEEREPSADAHGELIVAARAGDVARVRSLLEPDADVDAHDASGATALVAAAYGNHVDVARSLIEAGADVNVKDDSQQSAYLIATSEVGDDPRLLELTLANGADVDAKDSYSGTGLIRAADRGHVRIVERLLDTQVEIDHVNRLGWTALLEAIILGGGDREHIEVVRLLVEAGADVNLADGQGVTPLAHARRQGYDEIAAILSGRVGGHSVVDRPVPKLLERSVGQCSFAMATSLRRRDPQPRMAAPGQTGCRRSSAARLSPYTGA
jgi:uncharacterized protein